MPQHYPEHSFMGFSVPVPLFHRNPYNSPLLCLSQFPCSMKLLCTHVNLLLLRFSAAVSAFKLLESDQISTAKILPKHILFSQLLSKGESTVHEHLSCSQAPSVTQKNPSLSHVIIFHLISDIKQKEGCCPDTAEATIDKEPSTGAKLCLLISS